MSWVPVDRVLSGALGLDADPDPALLELEAIMSSAPGDTLPDPLGLGERSLAPRPAPVVSTARRCEECPSPVVGRGRWCSGRCRVRSWRRRKAA